jgi:hypothetical protein
MTLGSLHELELLQSLTASELLPRWDSGELGQWRDGLGEGGIDAHLQLLQGLASLDADEKWREVPLRCLPSASGGWICRFAFFVVARFGRKGMFHATG